MLIYVIFKLKLIKGKCIVFVGDIDRCYRLKLYLEQFGIKSCILNSELPVNSRIHVVEEFNKNVYDIIIASDELEVLGDEGDVEDRERAVGASKDVKEMRTTVIEGGEEALKDGDSLSLRPKKKRKIPKRDKEYGVSRGIDFKNVACVLSFDLRIRIVSVGLHELDKQGWLCPSLFLESSTGSTSRHLSNPARMTKRH